jgi:hypothetical protein
MKFEDGNKNLANARIWPQAEVHVINTASRHDIRAVGFDWTMSAMSAPPELQLQVENDMANVLYIRQRRRMNPAHLKLQMKAEKKHVKRTTIYPCITKV